jgi:hypothetical protein
MFFRKSIVASRDIKTGQDEEEFVCRSTNINALPADIVFRSCSVWEKGTKISVVKYVGRQSRLNNFQPLRLPVVPGKVHLLRARHPGRRLPERARRVNRVEPAVLQASGQV